LGNIKSDFLQTIAMEIENLSSSVVVSSVYCPPKHIILNEQFKAFLETLDACFIAVGDYNAKYQ